MRGEVRNKIFKDSFQSERFQREKPKNLKICSSIKQYLYSLTDNKLKRQIAIQPIMPAGVSACSTEGQKIKAEHEKAQKNAGSCATGCGCH